MNLGELFFALGFKSTGKGEAVAFESTIDALNTTMENLQSTVDQMLEIFEKVAVKMGAMTQAEIKQNREVHKGLIDQKTALQYDKDDHKNKPKSIGLIDALNKKMREYFGVLNATRLQVLGGGGALLYFTKKVSDAAVEIDKISSLTGMSAQSIQRVGDMAAQSGVDVNELAGAIKHFQEESVNIKLGKGGNIGAYQLLGLNPHDDPLVLMSKLSEKLKQMPTTLGTTLAKGLNLSDDLIYFLKNAENLKPPSEETILTDKEIKRLKDYNIYFNRIWEQSKRTLQKFGSVITPIANLLLYAFDRVTLMFSNIMTKMDPFIDKVQKFAPTLAAIGATLFAALFPVTAVILAIGAALEDLWSYSRGEDSLFGRMVKWAKDLTHWIDLVVNGLGFIADYLTSGMATDSIAKWTEKAANAAKSLIGNKKEDVKSAIMGKEAGIGGAKNTTNNVNITVEGAGKPHDVAKEVVKQQKKYTSDTYFQQPQAGY